MIGHLITLVIFLSLTFASGDMRYCRGISIKQCDARKLVVKCKLGWFRLVDCAANPWACKGHPCWAFLYKEHLAYNFLSIYIIPRLAGYTVLLLVGQIL